MFEYPKLEVGRAMRQYSSAQDFPNVAPQLLQAINIAGKPCTNCHQNKRANALSLVQTVKYFKIRLLGLAEGIADYGICFVHK